MQLSLSRKKPPRMKPRAYQKRHLKTPLSLSQQLQLPSHSSSLLMMNSLRPTIPNKTSKVSHYQKIRGCILLKKMGISCSFPGKVVSTPLQTREVLFHRMHTQTPPFHPICTTTGHTWCLMNTLNPIFVDLSPKTPTQILPFRPICTTTGPSSKNLTTSTPMCTSSTNTRTSKANPSLTTRGCTLSKHQETSEPIIII